MEEKFDFEFKIILHGGPLAGKTSLIAALTDNPFNINHAFTRKVQITSKNIIIQDTSISLIFWDPA